MAQNLGHLESDDVLLAVNPGAFFGSAKTWPSSSFISLLSRLLLDYPKIRIILFSGEKDREKADVLERSLPKEKVVPLQGKTSLSDSLAILSGCDYLLTNDSGMMHMGAALRITRDIRERFAGKDIMIVSPDVGGVVRARAIATRLNCDLAIIDKRRERAGVSEVMNVIGDVAGRDCILVDDIVDSGGTLCNAAAALIAEGAHSASVYTTHGVLSGGAVARITASPIAMMTLTDSIQATEAVRLAHNLRQLTIAPLLAEAMRRINDESSVSSLFE